MTDLIVYHARSYKEIKGDPLRDPNRHTRVQAVKWRADGTPDFGVPRKDDPAVP
ncbi:Glycosyl hydrolases family 43 [compost metagenome]